MAPNECQVSEANESMNYIRRHVANVDVRCVWVAIIMMTCTIRSQEREVTSKTLKQQQIQTAKVKRCELPPRSVADGVGNRPMPAMLMESSGAPRPPGPPGIPKPGTGMFNNGADPLDDDDDYQFTKQGNLGQRARTRPNARRSTSDPGGGPGLPLLR
jgi:hypothetical protein